MVDGVFGFDGGDGGEGPAGAAVTLGLDGGCFVQGSPVDAGRDN